MPIHRLSPELVAEILESYPGLSVLNLSNNEIATIENLGPLRRMEKLNLSNNSIEHIENLEELNHLRELYLSGNRIKHVRNLHFVPQIEVLHLADNLIADLDDTLRYLRVLPNLQRLVLEGNPVSAAKNYHDAVVLNLPTLKFLDFHEITEGERKYLRLKYADAPGSLKVDHAGEPAVVPKAVASRDIRTVQAAPGSAPIVSHNVSTFPPPQAGGVVSGDKPHDLSVAEALEQERRDLLQRHRQFEEAPPVTIQPDQVPPNPSVVHPAPATAVPSNVGGAHALYKNQSAAVPIPGQYAGYAQAGQEDDGDVPLRRRLGEAHAKCDSLEQRLHASRAENERNVSALAQMTLRAQQLEDELASVRQSTGEEHAALARQHRHALAEVQSRLAEAQQREKQLRAYYSTAFENGEQVEPSILTDLGVSVSTGHSISASSGRPNRSTNASSQNTSGNGRGLAVAESRISAQMDILSEENKSLKQRLDLVHARIDSIRVVCNMQEEQIAEGFGIDGTETEGALTRWREKVFELLVAQKSAAMDHKRREDEMTRNAWNLKDEVKALRKQLALAQEVENGRRAELRIEQTAAKLANVTMGKMKSHEQVLEQELERERQRTKAAVRAVITMRDNYNKELDRLTQGERRLNGYVERLRFALGRIGVIQSLEDKRAAYRLAQERSAVYNEPLPVPIGGQSSSAVNEDGPDSLVASLRSEIDRLTKERDSFARRLAADTEDALNHTRHEVELAERQAETRLRATERAAETRFAELSHALNGRSSELQNVSGEYEALHSRYVQQQQALVDLEAELSGARKQVADYRKKMESLELELARNTNQARQDADYKLQRVEEEHQSELSKMRNEQRELELANHRLSTNYSQLEREYAGLKEKSGKEERREIRSLQRQVDKKEDLIKTLRKERNTLLTTMKDVERRVQIEKELRAEQAHSETMSPPASPMSVRSTSSATHHRHGYRGSSTTSGPPRSPLRHSTQADDRFGSTDIPILPTTTTAAPRSPIRSGRSAVSSVRSPAHESRLGHLAEWSAILLNDSVKD